MELFVICLTALLAAMAPFFLGFGLGTVLLPVFALFTPTPVAVAAAAVVHRANNLLRAVSERAGSNVGDSQGRRDLRVSAQGISHWGRVWGRRFPKT